MYSFEPVLWPEEAHDDWLHPGRVRHLWATAGGSQLLWSGVTNKWKMGPQLRRKNMGTDAKNAVFATVEFRI